MDCSRMHRRPGIVAVALLVGLAWIAAPASAAPGEPTGEVNFLIGLKTLDESEWAPVDEHGMFAAEMSWGATDWPVHIATDIVGSAAEEDDIFFDPFLGVVPATVTGTTFEVDFGVRKIWEVGNFRPYLGGGIGLILGAFEAEFYGVSDDDNDVTLGPWAGGGVFWRLGSAFNLGFSARWSQGDVELFGVDVDAGGLSYGLLLGFGWPGK